MKHILYSALAALGLSVPSPVTAEPVPERESARVFVFGNSLIHHLTDTDETTVPHWLAEMARHDGRDLALDGRFGFPTHHDGSATRVRRCQPRRSHCTLSRMSSVPARATCS